MKWIEKKIKEALPWKFHLSFLFSRTGPYINWPVRKEKKMKRKDKGTSHAVTPVFGFSLTFPWSPRLVRQRNAVVGDQ